MKLLFVGDVHLADNPPSTRKPTYAQEILTKLVEVRMIGEEHGAAAIVFAGDIFHSKIPRRTSHWLVQKAIKVLSGKGVAGLSRNPIPAFVVPGNHDYLGANPSGLEMSPLGVVAEAGAVTLFGTPKQRSVALPPPPDWCRLFGVREEEPIEIFAEAISRGAAGVLGIKDSTDAIVAHSAIFPPGQEPPFDHFKAEDVAAQTGVPIILYGHIHDPHGIYEANGVLFVNPGSLSRGSLWEANPQRPVEVALIDTTEVTAKLIPLELSVKPWDQVFRVTEEHAKRDRSLAASDFASELMSASVEIFDVERVVAQLREREDVTTAVKHRAIELVEAVSL
jgi:DNA repair exonuclease SbcCD nuclease subunit